MDSPNREVTLLESFPPDIWAYIVCYLPGEQLGRLIMTGATFCRQRLKSTNVVKSIHLGRDFMVFKSFPKFLYDLPSLEELSIHVCYDQWCHRLGLTLDSIPSGVRTLEFGGSWRKIASNVFGATIGTWNLAEHLPCLNTLHLHDLDIADKFWLPKTPLTTLSLYHWDGTVELPSSLIHFEAKTVVLSKKSFVSKLPNALESFVVGFDLRGVDLVAPLLPPSIRKLSLGVWQEYSVNQLQQNLLEQLPKSITWLILPHSVELVTNPQRTSLLPSTVTELNICSAFPCSAWSLLPPNLKTLTFWGPESLSTGHSEIIENGIIRKVESYPFHLLPRSITSLHFVYEPAKNHYFCGPPATSYQSYFPPQLTSLKISKLQLSPETAKLLPASLTYLKIGNFSETVCGHLPAGLKTLIASQTMISPNLFENLPKSLTFLRLAIYPNCCCWFDDKTGEIMDSNSKIPEYTTHKMCVSQQCFQSKSLPRALVYLHMKNADELGDAFLSNQKLPNLLKLRLGTSKHFSDVSIPQLSPHLTTLELGSSTKISGKSFQFLPRCLTDLNLNRSESIFDSEIQHLPRTLKKVYLWRAKLLTDLCIVDLPPHLEMLDLRYNSLITPSSFSLFPYPLRSSQLDLSVEFASWRVEKGLVRQK